MNGERKHNPSTQWHDRLKRATARHITVAAYLLLLAEITCCFAPHAVYADPVDLEPFEDLTEAELCGFGDPWNRYAWSMATHDGDLYVGTWNQKMKVWRVFASTLLALADSPVDTPHDIFKQWYTGFPVTKSHGGEIWRYSSTTRQWAPVVTGGFNDRYNSGFRCAVVYNDRLYFGSANYENGSHILVISDHGQAITLVEPEENDLKKQWYANTSTRAMTVYGNKLYIGKENHEGAELWTYDGLTLKKIYKFQEFSLSELFVYGDYLFSGMWDNENGARLYRIKIDSSDTIISVDDMTPCEFRDSQNVGIMTMEQFRNRLFVGTANYKDGFSLFCFEDPEALPGDPDAYTMITTNGFEDPRNMYAWSLKEFDGALYLGTFNTAGTQLWYAPDGNSWEILMPDGFGSPWDWGIRTMAVLQQRLFLGIASSVPASALPGTPGGLKVLAGKPRD